MRKILIVFVVFLAIIIGMSTLFRDKDELSTEMRSDQIESDNGIAISIQYEDPEDLKLFHEEYDSLRNEVITEMENQTQTIEDSLSTVMPSMNDHLQELIIVIDEQMTSDEALYFESLHEEVNSLPSLKDDYVSNPMLAEDIQLIHNTYHQIDYLEKLLINYTFIEGVVRSFATEPIDLLNNNNPDSLISFMEKWESFKETSLNNELEKALSCRYRIGILMSALEEADYLTTRYEIQLAYNKLATIKVIWSQLSSEKLLEAEEILISDALAFFESSLNQLALDTLVYDLNQSEDLALSDNTNSVIQVLYRDIHPLGDSLSELDKGIATAQSDDRSSSNRFMTLLKTACENEIANNFNMLRAIQRDTAARIGLAGRGIQACTTVIDGLWDKAFGTGQKFRTLPDTLLGLVNDTDKDYRAGKLGVFELKKAVEYFDGSVASSSDATRWIVYNSTQNRFTAASAAYLARAVSGGLTALGKSTARLADPTSTPEEILESTVTLVLIYVGGDQVITGNNIAEKGIDVALKTFGDDWKSITKNYLTKWRLDISKTIARDLQGDGTKRFSGEIDEIIIDRLYKMLRLDQPLDGRQLLSEDDIISFLKGLGYKDSEVKQIKESNELLKRMLGSASDDEEESNDEIINQYDFDTASMKSIQGSSTWNSFKEKSNVESKVLGYLSVPISDASIHLDLNASTMKISGSCDSKGTRDEARGLHDEFIKGTTEVHYSFENISIVPSEEGWTFEGTGSTNINISGHVKLSGINGYSEGEASDSTSNSALVKGWLNKDGQLRIIMQLHTGNVEDIGNRTELELEGIQMNSQERF